MLTAPLIASRRTSTAALVAAVLPSWRGPVNAVRMARVLRRPVGEIWEALHGQGRLEAIRQAVEARRSGDECGGREG